jgi:hypothetical protein
LISRIRLRHLSPPPPTSISKFLSPTLYPLIPETRVFPSELQLRSRTRERPAELELLPSSCLLIFVFWQLELKLSPTLKLTRSRAASSVQLVLSQLLQSN